MVDLLLQGKIKGPQLIEKLRDSGWTSRSSS
jgi:hypothetical protein